MIFAIILTALGLAMDAFAATVALSIQAKKQTGQLIFFSFLCGFFQTAMPLLGYLLGRPFEAVLAPTDHWIAFFILVFLGGKMLFERNEGDSALSSKTLQYRLLFHLAVATSIDAFIVGIGFSALGWPLWESIASIGIITSLMCLIGVLIGKQTGPKFGRHANQVGGLILIGLGIKILVTHLFLQ